MMLMLEVRVLYGPGRTFGHWERLDTVKGDVLKQMKIIDVFICKLRKKLRLACDGEDYIETVWGPWLCNAQS
jgi:DNA-binding response OmpR family regulator